MTGSGGRELKVFTLQSSEEATARSSDREEATEEGGASDTAGHVCVW